MLSLLLAIPGFAADINIPFEKYELPNGLDVILAPDHSAPIVHVNIWYHVGSKNELPGKTGFAHLFEHLMFQGSAAVPNEYFDPLESVGAVINGSTNIDRTNYHETVPSEYLPLALFLESDRMGWLLDVFDQKKLDNQRDVVRNERRQRYDTPPYGTARIELYGALFPEGHPYHYPTIGSHEDLQAASVEDVSEFFKTWYVPNNASLVIAGDFDPAEAKKLVKLYFASIPAGKDSSATTYSEVALTQSQEIRKTSKVPHPRVWIAWRSPALFAPGDAELDLFSNMIAGGADGRLIRSLVHEQRIAQDVSVYQASAKLGSAYIIDATATPGHTTDELVAAIDRELAAITHAEPSEQGDFEAAKTSYEVDFLSGLTTIAGKAERLNTYNYLVGQPGYIAEDLRRYQTARIEDVIKFVHSTLDSPRVVLHYTPEESP